MTESATAHALRIPFCSLTELQTHRRVTRWMDDLRDEVTAFLIGGTIVVRSSVCVHMGGEFDVDFEKRKVCCRWHGWEFDLQTGECLTFPLPGRRLTPYNHVVEEGTLYLLRPLQVIEQTFTREVDAGRAAVLWNYWDHEHLVVVHKSYTDARIIYENDTIAVLLLTFRLPVLSFLKSQSLNVMVQHSPNDLKALNTGLFGIPVLTTVRITEDYPDHCQININYRVFLLGWKTLLIPFIRRMIPVWNKRVWQEDLPLKVRRHQMLRLGFRDFYGLPERVADRVFTGEIPFEKLPLSRLKEVNVNALKKFTFDDA